jgi:probable addiction module antidote protein
MNRTRPFRDYLTKTLQDPEEAATYLSVALDQYEEDANREAFLLALRTVVEAQGGISEVARRTGLNRQHLYRAFSGKGNPTWSTMDSVLGALGFRFAIRPLTHAHAS